MLPGGRSGPPTLVPFNTVQCPGDGRLHENNGCCGLSLIVAVYRQSPHTLLGDIGALLSYRTTCAPRWGCRLLVACLLWLHPLMHINHRSGRCAFFLCTLVARIRTVKAPYTHSATSSPIPTLLADESGGKVATLGEFSPDASLVQVPHDRPGLPAAPGGPQIHPVRLQVYGGLNGD